MINGGRDRHPLGAYPYGVLTEEGEMLGAIIGDIVGSVYEWNNIKTKEFPLFQEGCRFTDDTVMTVAVAKALLRGGEREDFVRAMKAFGKRYPDRGYGPRFQHWLLSEESQGYGSFGNGSAMRVSPVPWSFPPYDLRGWRERGLPLARVSAEVTHNHPEGEKGAMAVADGIFLCRYFFRGFGEGELPGAGAREWKEEIRRYLERTYGYDLRRTLGEIRQGYSFDSTCRGTVPQALIAFFESRDFEDAIRNAISLGGDSDTLAAITGSLAEGAYGIPRGISEKAMSFLDEELLSVLREFKEVFTWEKGE